MLIALRLGIMKKYGRLVGWSDPVACSNSE